VYDSLWVAVDLGKAAVSVLACLVSPFCFIVFQVGACWRGCGLQRSSPGPSEPASLWPELALYPLLVLWTDLVGLHLGVFMLGGRSWVGWPLWRGVTAIASC
jgi:hypothetical protein